MDFRPLFRLLPTKSLVLKASAAARTVAQRNRRATTAFALKGPEAVREEAKARILQAEGDPECWQLVLSESELQFGRYRGQTFKWLLSHDVVYACGILVSHMQEREAGKTSKSPLADNKDALASYARLFPQMVQVIQWRRMCEGFLSVRGMDQTLVGFGAHRHMTLKALYEATSTEFKTYLRWLKKQQVNPGSLMHTAQVYVLGREKERSAAGSSAAAPPPDAPPAQQSASRSASSAASAAPVIVLSDDDDLFAAAVEVDPLVSQAEPSLAGSTRPGPNRDGPVGDATGIEATLESEPRCPSSSEEEQQQEEDEEVVLGPDGHGGYQHATHLAQALVALREQPHVTQRQVREIGALWKKLSDRDKAPISFPLQQQKRLNKGRFKRSTRACMPNLDSLKRAFLGEGMAAQFPDASRLMEAVFLELCSIHQKGRTLAGVRVNRWSLIRSDYSRIRENLSSSRELSKAAPVQLLEVNQHTLLQWHHKRSKLRMVQMLCQGMPGPSASAAHAVASTSAAPPPDAPPAQQRASRPASSAAGAASAAPVIVLSDDDDLFAAAVEVDPLVSQAEPSLAGSTRPGPNRDGPVGDATGIEATLESEPRCPSSSEEEQQQEEDEEVVLGPDGQASTSAAHAVASTSAAHAVASTSDAHAMASTSDAPTVAAAVPRLTAWQRTVQEELERRRKALFGLPTKSRKKTEHVICKRCGQPKTREYGHSIYRSQHFCSHAEGRSVEDWLDEKWAEEVAQRQQAEAARASQTPSSQQGGQ